MIQKSYSLDKCERSLSSCHRSMYFCSSPLPRLLLQTIIFRGHLFPYTCSQARQWFNDTWTSSH